MCQRMLAILAAFVLVFFTDVETCMQAYEENDDNSAEWSALYKLTLHDSICIREETISLAENWWKGPLTKLYDTAEWDYQMDHEWSCSGGSCIRDDCINAWDGIVSPKGQKLDSKAPVSVVTRKYCGVHYGPACPLSTLCAWVNLNISVRSDDITGVYRVAEPTSKFRTVGNVNGCSYSVGTLRTPVVSGLTVLTKNSGPTMVCKESGNERYPVLGRLGDLQILENGSFVFDWASIEVHTDYYKAPTVSMAKSFMKTKPDLACRTLPYEIDGFKFIETSNGDLKIVDTMPVDVTLTCGNPPSVHHLVEECNDVVVEKHGIRQSNHRFLLSAQASSIGKVGKVRLRSACSRRDDIIFKCDNETHVFEIGADDACFDKVHGIVDKTVSWIYDGYVEEQHMLAQDWSSGWGLNSLVSGLAWKFLIGNLGVFAALAVIAVMLIVCGRK